MDGLPSHKRFVVIFGKGGVGRSTVASALGLMAARSGLRTVIAEFSTTSSLPRLFNRDGGGYLPVQLTENLYTVGVRPEPALHEYAIRKVRFEAIYKLVFENPAMKKVLGNVPGLSELLVLGKAFDLEREMDPQGKRAWDLVIVDAPATGHGISLFRLPQVLLELVQTGPLADEARAMRDLLWDRARTVVHLVSLAEELPAQETRELARATRDKLRMPLGTLFINRVWPERAPEDIQDSINEIRDVASGEAAKAVACFDQLEARRASQSEHLAKLRETLHMPQVVIPEIFDGARGLDALSDIGQIIQTTQAESPKETS